jgi:ion channel-forming bestrophin family protein
MAGNWFPFSLIRSRTLRQVTLLAVLAAAYASLPVIKENSTWPEFLDFPSQFHAALTLVLGSLLVFRTNTSHARWWEARTLWGSLVNASRNLAAKFSQLLSLPREELKSAQRDIISFAVAMKDHLREGSGTEGTAVLGGEVVDAHHIPAFLVSRRYAALKAWKDAGWIDGNELRVIDVELSRFLDICGGCERIRNTRVVYSYRMFARQSVIVFLVTLPWGIVNDFHWWTIPVAGIVAYFMLGLEIVAEHVEEPFGFDEDDLDLDRICESIERSVSEIVGIDDANQVPVKSSD